MVTFEKIKCYKVTAQLRPSALELVLSASLEVPGSPYLETDLRNGARHLERRAKLSEICTRYCEISIQIRPPERFSALAAKV